MNPNWGDASARLVADGMIMLKRAQFILQIHLRRPVRKEMREERKLIVPRPKLRPYLDNIPQRHQTVEPGLQCRGYEARLWRFDIKIKDHGHENFVLQADWEEVLEGCKIRENAVVSLWIYYEPPDPCTLIFRVDGYATMNSPLPSIPGIVNQSEDHIGGAAEGNVTRKDACRRF